jgi:Zinc finger, C2H2 type
MNSQPTTSLLQRFRRNKTCWPNPELSISIYIGPIQGKYNCWKAVGPAREAFEALAPKIKLHLNQDIDEITGSGWVTWSIYMIGDSTQTAKPTIMFFCDEQQPRIDAWQAIKNSNMLKEYPGMRSGHMISPPEFEYLDQLASSDNGGDGDGDGDAPSLSPSDYTIQIYGRRIVVGSAENGPGFPRLASVGGTVISDGIKYVLSSGHVFLKPRPKLMIASDEDDYAIDSDGGSDYDDASFQNDVDMTSKYSSASPEESQVRTDSTTDDGTMASIWDRLSRLSSSRHLERPLDSPTTRSEGQSEPNLSLSSKNLSLSENVGTVNPIAPLEIEYTSAPTIGTLVHLSIDLDYALIQVPSSFEYPNNIDEDGHSTAQPPAHIINETPKDVRVIARSSSVGVLAGNISSTPSYTRFPGSKTFQQVFLVNFNGPLKKGDSGIWVLDADSHGLYGHVVAGCEKTKTAYIIPAQAVFENAMNMLGSSLWLDRNLIPTDSMTDGIEDDDNVDISNMLLERWRDHLPGHRTTDLQERLNTTILDLSGLGAFLPPWSPVLEPDLGLYQMAISPWYPIRPSLTPASITSSDSTSQLTTTPEGCNELRNTVSVPADSVSRWIDPALLSLPPSTIERSWEPKLCLPSDLDWHEFRGKFSSSKGIGNFPGSDFEESISAVPSLTTGPSTSSGSVASFNGDNFHSITVSDFMRKGRPEVLLEADEYSLESAQKLASLITSAQYCLWHSTDAGVTGVLKALQSAISLGLGDGTPPTTGQLDVLLNSSRSSPRSSGDTITPDDLIRTLNTYNRLSGRNFQASFVSEGSTEDSYAVNTLPSLVKPDNYLWLFHHISEDEQKLSGKWSAIIPFSKPRIISYSTALTSSKASGSETSGKQSLLDLRDQTSRSPNYPTLNEDSASPRQIRLHPRRFVRSRHERITDSSESNPDKRHVCAECGRGFLYPKDLRRHLSQHSGKGSFHCTNCFKVFTRNDNLLRHMREDHSDLRDDASLAPSLINSSTVSPLLSVPTIQTALDRRRAFYVASKGKQKAEQQESLSQLRKQSGGSTLRMESLAEGDLVEVDEEGT